MKTFERNHRTRTLWRLVMQFGLFCTTTHLAFAQLTLTITTPPTLPDGLLNTPYSYTLSAAGGTPPYAWAVTGGSLPAGVTLADPVNGVVGGTPTTAGKFKFKVRVRDSVQKSDTKDLTLTINNPVAAITGISPNSAVAGDPGFTLTVNGSNFISGATHSTLQWNGSNRTTTVSNATTLTATIPAGDIATAGTASVTVNNPSPGGGASNALSFTISSPLSITTAATLPDGTLNAAYSQTLSASGGTPPYTWSVTSGTLPPGLSLTASNGTLSGTLTSSGTFSFTIQVQDSAQPTADSTTKMLTLTVKNPVPTITGISPNSAIAGDPGFTLTVNGSNFISGSTVEWNGSIRTTTFSSAAKLTASIPASDIASAGTASVTVNNPAPGGGGSNVLSFAIAVPPAPPPLTITSSSPLSDGVGASLYSQTLSASGGTPPYQWSVNSGSLPPGLSLAPGTGVLSGTPSAPGDFSFTLKISDNTQPTPTTATKAFTLRINNPVPAITELNPSSASASGSGFTLAVTGSNFISDSLVTWNGSNRPTRFINSTGLTASILPGDILLAGAADVAVRNPSPGGGKSNVLAFVVSPAVQRPMITTSSPLPNGVFGANYLQSLSASGGAPPYTWSVGSGSLPTGLALNSATGVISGTVSAAGTFQFTIQVLDAASASSNKSFQLLINPPVPTVSISGPADPLTPAQQPTIEMSLSQAYPSALSGQMTLTFTPDADEPSDDPSIQFATGGRAVSFTIAANSSQAVFPNSAPNVAFQSGTVSGTINLSVGLQIDGTDVTPAPAPNRNFRIDRTTPVITRLSIASQSTSSFEIELIGFSTPRSLTQVTFRFTPRAGSNLGATSFTLPLGPSSASWFQSATSKDFGSLFRLIMPFTVQGDVNAIESVSATLSNAEGSSNPSGTNF